MRRTLGPALALGLLTLTAPSALAAPNDSKSVGHCGFDTLNQQNVSETAWTGVLYAAVGVFSYAHGNVVTARVTCEIRVNGVPQVSASGAGAGLVAFAAPVTYEADVTDVVSLCTIVDYTSDPTPTSVACPEATTTRLPPQETIDLLSYVLGWVNGAVVGYVDPAACAAFQALAPGHGPVSITPEGDVYVGGEYFWDCPPYEYPPSDPPPFEPLPPFDPDVPPHGPTGGGYDTGDAGFLALTSPAYDLASACAFVTDRTRGTTSVVGNTTGAGLPDSVSVHCRLEDATTGDVVYDHTETATGPFGRWQDTLSAPAGPITVCTEGTGVWGTRTVTVGPYCRPGKEI